MNRHSRSSHACENCRRRKAKCSGTDSCSRCSRLGVECQFGNITRRGYSEAYVNGLLKKIRSQEAQLTEKSSANSITSTTPSDLRCENGNTSTPEEDSDPSQSEEPPLSPAAGLASGPEFVSRVRSIFCDHVQSLGSIKSPHFANLQGHDDETTKRCNVMELIHYSPPPASLPKGESRRLFELFYSVMGINQHFLDPRTFSDSLDLLYQDDSMHARQKRKIWYIEYLLVMAMGMLIGSPNGESLDPPGVLFFAEALRQLPPMHDLGNHGILSVEILCLIGIYLQWCHSKYEAYFYIGSAVRLAAALGCALPYDEQQGLSSEITHRTRVWWTAYMLDRRVSAGLSLPSATDDRHLRSDLPRQSVDFNNPLPMIINIQIAQVTSDIMTSFYRSKTLTRTELVERVQETLKTLDDIGRSIPAPLSIDFSDPLSTIARTSASLYIMLFQTIILCTRPILLQRVKAKVHSSAPSPQVLGSSKMGRLCRICEDAAIKNIKVVSALCEDRSIALFGYFDLDATFFAAFILTMVAFVNGDLPKSLPSLKQAANVLEYLSKAGNPAARRRLQDLKQLWHHIWASTHTTHEWSWLMESGAVASESAVGIEIFGEQETMQDIGCSQRDDENNANFPDPQAAILQGACEPSQAGCQNPLFDFSVSDNFCMGLGHEACNIHSSFNDPTLPLTGVDELDWAEVAKMFQRGQM